MFRVTVLLLAVGVCVGSGRAQTYTIQQIAAGTQIYQGARINDSGQVIYNTNTTSWVWSQGTGSSIIPGLQPGDEVRALAITNSGAIAGESDDDRAFLLKPGSGPQYIGFPNGGYSSALGLNTNDLAVGIAIEGSTGISEAYYWTPSVGPVNVAALLNLNRNANSGLAAVNGSGIMAGWGLFSDTQGRPEAFLYSQATGLNRFSAGFTLRGFRPSDINESNVVVGWIDSGGAGSPNWFYYANGVLTQHNTIFTPNAIDESGLVVGSSFGAGTMWTSQGGYVNASTLVTNGAGWTLFSLTDVNESGLIVGTGRNPAGQFATFVMAPVPEPASVLGLITGALLLYRRGRRS